MPTSFTTKTAFGQNSERIHTSNYYLFLSTWVYYSYFSIQHSNNFERRHRFILRAKTSRSNTALTINVESLISPQCSQTREDDLPDPNPMEVWKVVRVQCMDQSCHILVSVLLISLLCLVQLYNTVRNILRYRDNAHAHNFMFSVFNVHT